jgi:flagellar assembly protein FliH
MAEMIEVMERFRFDRDFEAFAGAGGDSRRRQPSAEPSFTQEDVELARAEGFGRGRAEAGGAEEARREAEGLRQQTLDAIVTEVRALLDASSASAEAAGKQAVLVAAAIVRKMMPRYWREGGGKEIEEAVSSVLAELAEETTITVRIAPTLQAELRPALQAAAAGCGADARLRIIADTAIAAGDCRIEWRDGGLLRDQQAMSRMIDQVIERSVGMAVLSVEKPSDTLQLESGNG